MRFTTCTPLILSVATVAQATVRLFVTTSSDGYGLENQANHMVPTESTVYSNGWDENAYDYADSYGDPGPLRPGSFPPADAPSGTPESPVLIAQGDWAYVWLQFQNEPKGAKISGLQVAINYVQGGIAPLSATYYLCNNMWSLGIFNKRWDGTATPSEYPEWHNNPQTMFANTAEGLVRLTFNRAWNLGAYDPASYWYMYLLGAVEAPADGTVYTIDITQISYAGGPGPPLASGVFQFGPGCTGDLNCDGAIDFADINPFVLLLTDQAAWQTAFPGCAMRNGDINSDGTYGQWSFGDINPFVALMTDGQGPCP
jgi:hypothetical protein